MHTAAITRTDHLAVAAFLTEGRKTLLDLQALKEFTPENQKKGRAFARPSPTGRYEATRANSTAASKRFLYLWPNCLNDEQAARAALPSCVGCIALTVGSILCDRLSRAGRARRKGSAYNLAQFRFKADAIMRSAYCGHAVCRAIWQRCFLQCCATSLSLCESRCWMRSLCIGMIRAFCD